MGSLHEQNVKAFSPSLRHWRQKTVAPFHLHVVTSVTKCIRQEVFLVAFTYRPVSLGGSAYSVRRIKKFERLDRLSGLPSVLANWYRWPLAQSRRQVDHSPPSTAEVNMWFHLHFFVCLYGAVHKTFIII
jgi:hypothetical protein